MRLAFLLVEDSYQHTVNRLLSADPSGRLPRWAGWSKAPRSGAAKSRLKSSRQGDTMMPVLSSTINAPVISAPDGWHVGARVTHNGGSRSRQRHPANPKSAEQEPDDRREETARPDHGPRGQ